MRRILIAGIILTGLITPACGWSAEPFERCFLESPAGSRLRRGFIDPRTCRPLGPGESWVGDRCEQGYVPVYEEGNTLPFRGEKCGAARPAAESGMP